MSDPPEEQQGGAASCEASPTVEDVTQSLGQNLQLTARFTVEKVNYPESVQLALESTGELLPADELIDKIKIDLREIRDQFPEVADVRHIPKWKPGKLIVDPEATGTIQLIHIGPYGPIEFLQNVEDKTFLVTFTKPYHPEKLSENLKKFFRIGNTTPEWLFGGTSPLTLTIDSSKKNTYRIMKSWEEKAAGCIKKRVWTFSSMPGKLVKLDKIVLDYILPEAQQIALEGCEELLRPDNLVKRVGKDLQAIRAKFPELAEVYHNPKWKPGKLMLYSVKPGTLEKLDEGPYGPIDTQATFEDKNFIVTFNKPYNPEILAELLIEELGVDAMPECEFGASSSISLATIDPSGKNTYLIMKRSGNEIGCGLKELWTFSNGLEENSVKLENLKTLRI